VNEAKLKFTVDNEGDFRLLFDVGDDRSQLVWILSRTNRLEALEIREVWSIGYQSERPLSADIANRLLEQNAKVKLGSWQLRRMGDKYTAVFSAQIAAETDRATLLAAIRAVTTIADRMELDLTNKDGW